MTCQPTRKGEKGYCGKKGLVREALGINTSREPLNVRHVRWSNSETMRKERIDGLIEILGEGICRKLDN